MKIQTAFKSKSRGEYELPAVTAEIKNFFQQLSTKGVKLLIAFSEGDIGEQYVQNTIGSQYNALKQSGLIQSEILCSADHLVTPLACQKHLLELVVKWLNETA